MASGIYAIQQISTGRMYIGSAVNIKKRWNEHKSALSHSKHHSKELQRSWNECGEEDFRFRILDYVEQDELIVAEQQWMDSAKPFFNSIRIAHSSGGAPVGSKRPVVTHCKRGHPLSEDNTIVCVTAKRTYRSCRLCRKDIDARANAKERSKRTRHDAIGENNGCAILTREQVDYIKSQPNIRGSGIALAEQFGVSRATISMIQSGKRWNH